MKFHYFPETDSLYIELMAAPSALTEELSDSVRVDRDAAGHIVGFDIDCASQQFDLSSIETHNLPTFKSVNDQVITA